MFTAPTTWLVGEETRLAPLARALERHGGRVERIDAGEVSTVLEKVRAGALTLLPNLIVLSREVAEPGGGAPLDTLATRAPWRLVPLIIVSGEDDPDACRRAYAAGASSWTVLPEDGGDEVAEAFARYWLETAMLPSPVLPG